MQSLKWLETVLLACLECTCPASNANCEQLDKRWVNTRLKISEAMNFKSEIKKTCNLDVKMLETSNDGLILTVSKRLVNSDSLQSITAFVNDHKLNLMSEFGIYYISTQILEPALTG